MRLLTKPSFISVWAMVICLMTTCCSPETLAADAHSVRIDALEMTLFGKTSKKLAPEQRVSAIEKKVFGKAKQGGIKGRLDAVSQVVDTGSATQLMPPAAPVKDMNAAAPPAERKEGRINVTEVQPSPSQAEALLNEGIRLESQGRVNEAVQKFHQAISMDHYNANAYFNLGVVAEKSGDLQGALRNYRMAASIQPHDGEFQQAVGSMQAQLHARQPVFAPPPYMVPQQPMYQSYPPPVVSVPYSRPPQVGVTDPGRRNPTVAVSDPRRRNPMIGATARAAVGIGASMLFSGGRLGGIDIGCPLCRMLGGL